MNERPFHRARDVFWRALERSADQREAFLDAACEGDESLRREVASLLAHEASPKLERPLFGSGFVLAPGDTSSPETELPAAAPIGRTLGDFRIEREIGRGGMGVVYQAMQISLQRPVALKVLPAHGSIQEVSVERFRREAGTAAHLEHPGIVRVLSIGEAEGTHYFAMELVEGAPLDRVLARLASTPPESLSGRMLGEAVLDETPWRSSGGRESAGEIFAETWDRPYLEAVCRVVIQIADALDHAQRAGVVHRDVKPSNILVRADGSAVLTDFGLAREEMLPSLTRTGQFAGTPGYVSPEQAEGLPLDHRSDVFSLGITLYEMLTSRRPFEGKNTAAILAAISSRDPAPPRRWNPLIPRDLENVCLSALEKAPSRRYANAGELAADLRRFLEYRPVKARPVGRARRVARWIRRNPALAAALLVALLSAAGGAATLIRSNQELAEAATRQKGLRLEAQQEARRASLSAAVANAATARLAAQRGDWRAALVAFDRALAAGHPDPISLELGKVEAHEGLLDHAAAGSALEVLMRREDMGPHRARILLFHAIHEIHRARDRDVGIHGIQTAVDLHEQGRSLLPPADLALARAFLEDDLIEQKELLEAALSHDQYHHRGYVALSHLLLLLGRIDEARELAIRFRAIFPEDSVAAFVDGATRLWDSGPKQADAVLEQLARDGFEEVASSLEAYRAVLELAVEVDDFLCGSLFDLESQGLLAGAPSRLLRAAAFFRRVSPLVQRLVGAQAETVGPNMQLALPERVFESLVETRDRFYPYLLSGFSDRALLPLSESLIEFDERFPTGIIRFFRGLIASYGERFEEAERHFLTAAHLPSPVPLRNAPLFYAVQVEAILYLKALPSDPETANRFRSRASRTIQLILKADHLRRDAYRYLLDTALDLGLTVLADEIAARWQRQYPEASEAQVAQARVARVQGSRAHAKRFAETALRLDPGNRQARKLLEEMGETTGGKLR